MSARSLVRWALPYGLVKRRREIMHLRRLNLDPARVSWLDVESARYELWPRELRASERLIVVDVGANFGAFSSAVRRLRPLAKLHLFEPQPECLPTLRELAAEGPGGQTYPIALGARAGETLFQQTENPNMASVLIPDEYVCDQYARGDMTVRQTRRVRLSTLDEELGSEAIDIMKIDVQGSELAVLEGAARTLLRTRALLIEVNYVSHYMGGATFDQVFDAVRSYGFRTVGISGPYFGTKGPLWADAMFFRCL